MEQGFEYLLGVCKYVDVQFCWDDEDYFDCEQGIFYLKGVLCCIVKVVL